MLLGTLIVACSWADARALEPVVHKPWTLGLGFGLGQGEITVVGEEPFKAADGATPQIVVLHSLSSRMRAGVTWQDWLTERGDGETRIRRSMQMLAATVLYRPGDLDNAWSGFYLRGGAGITTGRFATVEPDEHGEDFNQVATDQTGWGAQFGVGYEFQIATPFAAGMLLNANYAQYDDATYEKGWFVPLSFTLQWTF